MRDVFKMSVTLSGLITRKWMFARVHDLGPLPNAVGDGHDTRYLRANGEAVQDCCVVPWSYIAVQENTSQRGTLLQRNKLLGAGQEEKGAAHFVAAMFVGLGQVFGGLAGDGISIREPPAEY